MMRLARIEEDAKQQERLAEYEVRWACWLVQLMLLGCA